MDSSKNKSAAFRNKKYGEGTGHYKIWEKKLWCNLL
jgi:hypothetical protein